MSAIFVTATGTDIGKTFVTAALIHEFRRRGRAVDALKPVASGFDPARLGETDAGILLGALGQGATQEALGRIAPWRYSAPLSPNMASRRDGPPLDFNALIAFTRDRVEHAKDLLLIEGVGGIMVPLDDQHTVLDWMAALRLPALLIAGSYLGAISHTLTAVAALRQRAIGIRAVVINESAGSGVDLGETVETLSRFIPQPVPIVAVPRLPSAETAHPALQSLAELL